MISLQNYSTFGLPSKALDLIEIFSIEELKQTLTSNIFQSFSEYLILGSGSNTIFTKDFLWLILKNNILGKKIIKDTDKYVRVEFSSWEIRNDCVERCIERNYWWIENLIFIPWTVGAAPIQNIWAYGVELKDSLLYVDGVFVWTGQEARYTLEECQLWYRDSIFKHKLKNKFFITSITLQLIKVTPNYHWVFHYQDVAQKLWDRGYDPDNDFVPLRVIADTIIELRQKKLPDWTKIWTAGSFFKNPIVSAEKFQDLRQIFPSLKGHKQWETTVKLSAWQLIDLCGLKGYHYWGAAIYDKHALVLINKWTAKGEELIKLITYIQDTVKEKFSIGLEAEVNVY